MRDLIRNYRLTIERKNDSDSEIQPLTTSSSSTSSFNYGGIFDGFSETETELETNLIKNYREKTAVLEEQLQGRTLFPNSTTNNTIHRISNVDDEFSRDNYDEICGMTDMVECTRTNSSFITIFSIWNTAVGSSLLVVTWAIERTGLFPAIFLNCCIAAICLYTAHLIVTISDRHATYQHADIADVANLLLGRWALYVTRLSSILVLLGANVIYWVLMSNFLYNSVYFIYEILNGVTISNNTNTQVLCPRRESFTPPSTDGVDWYWDLYSTVPIILAILMYPLLNWHGVGFFTKFNSLGTLSVIYLMIFVSIKGIQWGFNVDWTNEWYFKSTFCTFTGMLALSYFVHTVIVRILRNNRQPKNNSRDLVVAFSLISFTYLYIGTVFYTTFPLPKFCLEDNLLNNFDQFDTLTIIARLLLLFQLFTVFPLLTFVVRHEIFSNFHQYFMTTSYKLWHVMALNAVVVAVCVLFACFMPNIGTLIRFIGAVGGSIYIFILPCLLKIICEMKNGKLTICQIIGNSLIIILGICNMISQFFINDD